MLKYLVIAIIAVIGAVPAHSYQIDEYLTENDMAYCEENYGQYRLIGSYQFLEREQRTLESRVCVHLYGDPVWGYEGSDRVQRLLERGNHYVGVEIEKSAEVARMGVVTAPEKPVSDLERSEMRATELENRVKELEAKIAQKDAVILEQIKVIMQLVDRIKSIAHQTALIIQGMF